MDYGVVFHIRNLYAGMKILISRVKNHGVLRKKQRNLWKLGITVETRQCNLKNKHTLKRLLS